VRDWKLCPRCGHELARLGAGREFHVACLRCRFVRYDNPLPTTVGVVERDGRYLLLRRAHEPNRGAWDTVGGFVSPGETAEECLAREAREEIGCAVLDLTPLGTYPSVYGDTGLHTLGIAFRCTLEPGAAITLSTENTEFAWFEPAGLPPVAFADVQAALDRATG
jgi:NAD+ diphosphatase